MQAMRFLFSPLGRIQPQAFVAAVIAVYVAGAASQWLTMPEAVARGGLWLFAALQALLAWLWFALHAKRLRDAGRAIGLAAGVAILYALSIVLLLIVAVAFFTTSGTTMAGANTASALGLILLVSIIATLSGSSSHDLASLIVAILTALAFVPIVLALIVTLWAATRPSAKASPA